MIDPLSKSRDLFPLEKDPFALPPDDPVNLRWVGRGRIPKSIVQYAIDNTMAQGIFRNRVRAI